VIHDHFKAHDVLDRKLQDWEARLARETRVGWPTLTTTAILILFGVLVSIYLALDACVSR